MASLGISICGALVILLMVYYSQTSLNHSLLEKDLESSSSMITKAYVEPIWSFDKTQIVDISNTFLRGDGFVNSIAIKVIDSKGVILFYGNTTAQKDWSFEKITTLPYVEFKVGEIIKNGEVLGKVYTAFSNENSQDNFKNSLVKILFFVFSIYVLMSFGIHLFFNKIISKPLSSLLRHIDQIKQEDFEKKDYNKMVYEFELIANALNYTTHLIKIRNQEMRNHTDNLEELVIEKTKDLKEQAIANSARARLAEIGEMAANIAHEINNPLTVIDGQVLRLKRHIQDDEQKIKLENYLDKISLMTKRIVKIINGLKLTSRDGHNDPMIEFSIPKMLEEIVFLTEIKSKSMGIEINLEIDPTICFAYGKEVQISQVMVNLINNSMDAIASQKGPWINIAIKDRLGFVDFIITDSGEGIPLKIREKIMTPFFTTKELGKGTGLGLSISMAIIKEHGGEFSYNEQSPNTQFVFSIHKKSEQKIAI